VFQTVFDPQKQQCVLQFEGGKAYMFSVLLVLLDLIQHGDENE